MALKPGPKPIAKSTGEVDKRRRDNKDTQGNNPDLKPSKSSKKQVFAGRSYSNGGFCHWSFQENEYIVCDFDFDICYAFYEYIIGNLTELASLLAALEAFAYD